MVSSNQFTYIIEADTGSIIFKKNFSSIVKPILINEYLFLISKNKLLIVTDIKNGKIIYSIDINQKIADYLSTKINHQIINISRTKNNNKKICNNNTEHEFIIYYEDYSSM